jgi:PAS domain S-box-containing protein
MSAAEPHVLGGDASLELLDQVGCGIWVYDGEDIRYVNHALEDLTGYSRAELLQPSFFQKLVHDDDREFMIERGHARLRGEPVPEQYEVKIVHRDGRVRTLAIHAKRVCLNQVPVSVVSATDVTPLREAEQAVRDGTNRLMAFLNAVPAHIIATNPQGKPTFVNRHWLEFTGQSLEEAMAHGTAPLIHPDDVAEASRRWAEARRNAEAYEIEYRVRDREGTYRWQMFRIQPVVSEQDQLLGWTSISIDVHETRQLREELQETIAKLADAIASKDEVLGLISHELRTPLTTLMGNASYLLRHGESLGEEGRAGVAADLAADSRRLYAVIENMLVLSRMETGAQLETEPARLNRLVETVIEEFSQRSPAREIRLEAPETLPLVLVNPTYYKQVVGNLLSNADKYSPATGAITVTLGVEDNMLVTSVLDSGPGIQEDELDRVFAPFFRSSGHAKLTGTGLGLTVCRRLVELHGGTISVRNLEGGGCRFWFTTPIPDFGEMEE